MVQNTKPVLFIKGWINRSDYSWNPEPCYWFSTERAQSDESIGICEHTLSFQVPLTEDEIIQARVEGIKSKLAENRTRFIREQAELDDKLANLLCLPSPKAVSPDSEGGAEVEEEPRHVVNPACEDVTEVPNDGFAPNETSFG